MSLTGLADIDDDYVTIGDGPERQIEPRPRDLLRLSKVLAILHSSLQACIAGCLQVGVVVRYAEESIVCCFRSISSPFAKRPKVIAIKKLNKKKSTISYI